jgi:hypothetical protein
MIHKKGGRIRTPCRPAPAPLGWVAVSAPLVASVPETDALRYPAPFLFGIQKRPLFRLCHYQSRGTTGPAAPDRRRALIPLKQGPANHDPGWFGASVLGTEDLFEW